MKKFRKYDTNNIGFIKSSRSVNKYNNKDYRFIIGLEPNYFSYQERYNILSTIKRNNSSIMGRFFCSDTLYK